MTSNILDNIDLRTLGELLEDSSAMIQEAADFDLRQMQE